MAETQESGAQQSPREPSVEQIAYSVWMLPMVAGLPPLESLFASWRCPDCGDILAPDRGETTWHMCAGGHLCLSGDWLYGTAWALHTGRLERKRQQQGA